MKKILSNKNIKVALFLLIISFSIYWKLFDHFYEQDEWMGVGHVKALGIAKVFESGFLPAIITGNGRPIAGLINYFFFTHFTFEAFPFAFLSIILHGLTAYSLFLLLGKFSVEKLSQNIVIALFFLINAVSSQGVMWFSTAIAAELSTLLLILSMIFFMDFDSKQSIKKYLLSISAFYLSFLTKETGVLFSIFFIAYLFIENKEKFIKKIKYTIPYLAISAAALFRYVLIFLSGDKIGKIITTNSQPESSLLANIIFYPLKSLSHFFISPEYLLEIFKSANEAIVSPGELVTLSNMVLSLSIALMLFFVYMFVVKKLNRKIFVYGLLVYLVSILPYTIIEMDVFLESRYYYTPLIGIAIILSSFNFKKNYKNLLIFSTLFIVFLIIQISTINQRLNQKIDIAKTRRKMVEQLIDINLDNNKKNIFFIDSDSPDYVVSNQVLPFQQGIGYTLMVLYHEQGVIPQEFLMNNYLWDMGTQGIFRNNDYLFGFFVEEDRLNIELSNGDYDGANLIKVHFNKNYEANYDETIL